MRFRCPTAGGLFVALAVSLVAAGEEAAEEYRNGQRRYLKQIDLHPPAFDAAVPTDKPAPERSRLPATPYADPPAPAGLEGTPAANFAPVRLPPAPGRAKSKNWIVPAGFSESEPGGEEKDSGWGWLADEALTPDASGIIQPEEEGNAKEPEDEDPDLSAPPLEIRPSGDEAIGKAKAGEYEPLIRDRPVNLTRRSPSGLERNEAGSPEERADAASAPLAPGEGLAGTDGSDWSVPSADNWGNRSIWDRDRQDAAAMPLTESLLSQIAAPVWSSREGDSDVLKSHLPASILPASLLSTPTAPALAVPAGESSVLVPPSWNSSRGSSLPAPGGAGGSETLKALEALKPTEVFKPLND